MDPKYMLCTIDAVKGVPCLKRGFRVLHDFHENVGNINIIFCKRHWEEYSKILEQRKKDENNV